MDDQSQQDEIIEEGELVEETSEDSKPQVTKSDQATVMLSLEEMIKNNIDAIDKDQVELKKLRQTFADGFINDTTYREHEKQAKEAAKIKSQTKQQILQQPAIRQLAEKIKGLSADLKERKQALSDYLLEYQRMAGVNEIEALDGSIREIVNEAKLIKRNDKRE